MDYVLVEGDQIVFSPAFGLAVVVVKPGRLAGSGRTAVGGKSVCVDGDERRAEVSGCPYVTREYPIPGIGRLRIRALAADQLARRVKDGGRAVLLEGRMFEALFEVDKAAKRPNPPGPPLEDATPSYRGEGRFETSNKDFKAD